MTKKLKPRHSSSILSVCMKVLLPSSLVLVSSSCTHYDFTDSTDDAMASVTLSISTPMVVNIEDMPTISSSCTRAPGELSVYSSTRSTLSDVGCNYLYIYMDGELILTQQKGDASFGSPSFLVRYGTHSFTVIASSHELSSSTSIPGTLHYESGRIQDTFGLQQSVNVQQSTSTISMNLTRIVCAFKFNILDALPDNTATATVTSTKHYASLSTSFLRTTEEPTSYTMQYDVSSSAGKTGVGITTMSFIPQESDTWNTDVSITFRDTEGNALSTRSLTIPMEINSRVNISGSFFSENKGLEITADNTWKEVNMPI